MGDDWFTAQLASPPNLANRVPAVPKPKPQPCLHSKQKEFVLSIRNNTFYCWNVVLGGVVSTSSNATSINVPSITVLPNETTSQRLNRRININETLQLSSIECLSELSSCSGLVLHVKNCAVLAFHAVEHTTSIVVTIDWGHSSTLYGHMVPVMAVDTVGIPQTIPCEANGDVLMQQ